MKLAVMQPYLFPYLGYYQLIAAVDRFVVYDDVNFIKKGWVNRNRILVGGREHLFTIPISNLSQNRLISEMRVDRLDRWLTSWFRTLQHHYARAPFYGPTRALLERIFTPPTDRLSDLLFRSLSEVCRYIGLTPDWVPTSSCYENRHLKGQDRILDICVREKADEYINLPGGRQLYEPAAFAVRGIRLRFLEPNLQPYPQSGGPFVPGLSVIDVLMFNSPERVRAMAESGRLE